MKDVVFIFLVLLSKKVLYECLSRCGIDIFEIVNKRF